MERRGARKGTKVKVIGKNNHDFSCCLTTKDGQVTWTRGCNEEEQRRAELANSGFLTAALCDLGQVI